ncbi:hypothetical protein KKF34_18075 [Myxococcota bacterium]|nr:hypothetical protein [Myxococcota bacterium]MBU1498793.1 hypothetical protein [Myxococcota bacterium]
MRPKILILFMMLMPPIVLVSLLLLPGPRALKVTAGLFISLIITQVFALAFPPSSIPLKSHSGLFEGEEVIYEESCRLKAPSETNPGRLLLTQQKISFRPTSAAGFPSDEDIDIPLELIQKVETLPCPDDGRGFQETFEDLTAPAPLSLILKDNRRFCFIVKNRFSWLDKIASVRSFST